MQWQRAVASTSGLNLHSYTPGDKSGAERAMGFLRLGHILNCLEPFHFSSARDQTQNLLHGKLALEH